MFRRSVLGGIAAAIGLFTLVVPAPAAVIATGTVRKSHDRSPGLVFDSVSYKFALPPTGSLLDRAPGLFSNRTITPADSGGTLFVATAATDPFFNDVVANLTNGSNQTLGHVTEWLPDSGHISSSNTNERSLFGLPTNDLQGQTIRAIGLQVNLVDQFFYTSRDTNEPVGRYRFEATIIVSDTETIDAPSTPVAIATAGRENAFRVMPGESLVLDGSRSVGDIELYEWDLDLNGTTDVSTTSPRVTLAPSEYAPYFSMTSPPMFPSPIVLTVTDASGNRSIGLSDGVVVVPEPSCAMLLAAAAGGLALTRRRRPARRVARD